MINQTSVEEVAGARYGKFVRPLYHSYCFSNIPGTIIKLLTGREHGKKLPDDVLKGLPREYDKVVVILVDGFGWSSFERYFGKYPIFRRALSDGVISKLTSQFPSTTAAHVTTMHTGLPVGESGVYEWFYYEPEFDEVIAPLLFSLAGDSSRNTLSEAGVSPGSIFPNGDNLYRYLARREVNSYLFQHSDYAFAPYNQIVCQGAMIVPYNYLKSALKQFSQIFMDARGKSYFFFYWGDIDIAAHRHGPCSYECDKVVDFFFKTLHKKFFQKVAGKNANTLLIITADHGQIAVDPRKTVYLDERFAGFSNFLKSNRQGKLLVPAGSPRDFFLHVKEDLLEQAEKVLGDLQDIAQVCRIEELITGGMFGAAPGETFMQRVGNLVLLPYDGQTVFWHGDGKFRNGFWGLHGGASIAEMETIFIALPL